ncbi:MAG: hypothetical protein LZF84_07420, partial [Nitrosomonas sp.]
MSDEAKPGLNCFITTPAINKYESLLIILVSLAKHYVLQWNLYQNIVLKLTKSHLLIATNVKSSTAY